MSTTRINVYETDEYGSTSLAGWFNLDRATVIDSGTRWDGNNVVPIATGSPWVDEYLIRTAGGRWVIRHNATRYHNGRDSYRYIDDDAARLWMVENEAGDDLLAAHFGPVEEEVRFGRPEIGPQIKIRVPEDVLAQIDAKVADTDLSRSAWVRRAIEAALR